jgi:ribokinase
VTDVCLLGDINIDVLMPIPEYPPNGGDAIAAQVLLKPGGSAANTAAALAKLGVQARLIAQTGNDEWSRLAVDSLRRCGVDLSQVRIEPGKESNPPLSTGLIFIPITPDGERTMFSYRGANANLPEQAVTLQALGQSRILHLSSYSFLHEPQRLAAWKAVEIARQTGIPLSLDVGVEPTRRCASDLQRLLPGLQLLVLGLNEARELLGEDDVQAVIKQALQQGVKILGLKMGSRGCVVSAPGQVIEIPPWQVPVTDSTGAGDAFCAGMLFGILRQLSMTSAGWLANTLGALAATQWGGVEAMPSLTPVLEFLHQQHDSLPASLQAWNAEALAALGSV